ncbi:MAG TPA: hypothetical protein VFF06_07285 [Polyangia bacterium]|nr:hypothetical protein [Polyangia bacterium]
MLTPGISTKVDERALLAFLVEAKAARVRCVVVGAAAGDRGAALLDKNTGGASLMQLAALVSQIVARVRRHCEVFDEELEYAVCAYDVPAANGIIPEPTARCVMKARPARCSGGEASSSRWQGLIPPTSRAYRRGSIHDGTAAELERMRAQARGSPFFDEDERDDHSRRRGSPGKRTMLDAALENTKRRKK